MNNAKQINDGTYELDVVCVRLVRETSLYSQEHLNSPKAVTSFMVSEMEYYDREVCCVINLNTKNQPISMNVVSIGSINCSVVAMREVLKSAILSNAAHIMFFHNHPSGDVTPSQEDIKLTQKISEACSLMDIPLIDHVIAGKKGEYFSFLEEGILNSNNKMS